VRPIERASSSSQSPTFADILLLVRDARLVPGGMARELRRIHCQAHTVASYFTELPRPCQGACRTWARVGHSAHTSMRHADQRECLSKPLNVQLRTAPNRAAVMETTGMQHGGRA
jgi:hypothetical protein